MTSRGNFGICFLSSFCTGPAPDNNIAPFNIKTDSTKIACLTFAAEVYTCYLSYSSALSHPVVSVYLIGS